MLERTRRLRAAALAAWCGCRTYGFVPSCPMGFNSFRGAAPAARLQQKAPPLSSSVSMVFDYFKKRAEEGVKQAQNIGSLVGSGKIGQALAETGSYIKERQEADGESIAKFADGLARSRERLVGDLNRLLGMGSGLEATLEQLEELLMAADIGAATTQQIVMELRELAKTSEKPLLPEDIKSVLRGTLIEVLTKEPDGADASEGAANPSAIRFAPAGAKPSVIFVLGANGMGKTTTIGKISHRLRSEGDLKVLVAAADTFRAAAVEQLADWVKRADADICKPISEGEKAPNVVARACARAKVEGYDVLVVDTCGRLSNNRNLNKELREMKSAIAEGVPGGPHETLLVVDAAVGRNAVDQARIWKKEVGLTGLVVTKLDGTARGGFVVSITRDLGIPVKLIGVGEKLDDLRDFDAPLFVDSLLGIDAAEAQKLAERWESNSAIKERVTGKMREKANAERLEAEQAKARAQAALAAGAAAARPGSSKARRRTAKKQAGKNKR